MKRLIAIIVIMCLALIGLTSCKPAPAGQHRAPAREHAPAPNADPPPPNKTFPGNVSITLWWEQRQSRTIVVFDWGQGKQHKTGKHAGHWDATVKPGQTVYGAVVPANPGEKGHIALYITNNANGTKICSDSNDDTEGNGGADCGGVVTI